MISKTLKSPNDKDQFGGRNGFKNGREKTLINRTVVLYPSINIDLVTG